jgi:predicted AAA+ superfamily ATPase
MGPRQSGKTTIAQITFPHLPYITLERLADREFAREDPEGFLSQYPAAIIDEIQHVPELLSSLQVKIDQLTRPSCYVITGSQNLILNEKITQTLAGRIALTTLLPLSVAELKPECPADELIYKGFYPRLHNYTIKPIDFYPSYIATYVERDVRQIKQIVNLSLFQKFLKHCAARIGQLLNLQSLANDCGISHTTARQWLTMLEISYIVYLLKPHHRNFNKRLIKSPKLYFYDTGLACSLLNIQNESNVNTHYLKGSLFENLIVIDLLKQFLNRGLTPNLYFWQDKTGHEIDIVQEEGEVLIPIEVKSAQTVVKDFFANLDYFRTLSGVSNGYLVYGGKQRQERTLYTVCGWQEFLNRDAGTF